MHVRQFALTGCVGNECITNARWPGHLNLIDSKLSQVDVVRLKRFMAVNIPPWNPTKMKESAFLISLSLTAFAFGAPSGVSLSNPAIQLQAEFDQNNIGGASGIVNLQSGQVSVAAARGSGGKVAFGAGLHEKGLITFGNYGKISIKGMSTIDGMYQAVVDSELFTGQRSFSPLQVTVMKTADGLQYSGSTSLGYLGGTYEGSTGSFIVNLDTDGLITANAIGMYKDNKIKWKGYNATVNLGIVSAAINMDDQMKILDYELGGSLGIIHGAMHRNQQTKGTNYRGGLNLGIVNFEAFIQEDNSRTYSTQLDTGMMRFAYNADPKNDNYNWRGSLNMANMAIDYAQDKEGLTLGGKMQVGESIISVQRDPKGKFTVKVDRGLMIQ